MLERLAAEMKIMAVSEDVAVVILLPAAATAVRIMALLLTYQMWAANYHMSASYPALYSKVLNLFACALCLAGGVASLKKRCSPLTLVIVFLLFTSGAAALIAIGLGS